MTFFDDEKSLTERQKEIWQWMLDHQETWQMAPTTREIGAEFGITQNGVMCHLKALVKKGAVVHRPGALARCYVAVGRRKTCPHCGEELEG